MLKLLLIEDEFIIAKDLQLSLENDDYAKVTVARNGAAAIEAYKRETFDIVVSDINLNEAKDGIAIIRELSAIRKCPVVYLTAYADNDIVARAEETMPFAYLLKPFDETQLKVTVRLALVNFKNQSSGTIVSEAYTNKLELLTEREKEILTVFAEGKTSKEVANMLHISPQTAEKHKKNIKTKLEMNTIGELVKFAVYSGLS